MMGPYLEGIRSRLGSQRILLPGVQKDPFQRWMMQETEKHANV